jgi:hypothetical protein
MKRTLFAAATLLAAASLGAQEGATLNGYGRTKVGSLIEDGSYFIGENTLDLRLNYRTGDAGFFANPVLYEREGAVDPVDLREAYIDFSGERFDLRFGKQQVIWGKADGVFITDLVSPKDLSQFLVPDFEELRRAVTGVRADFYLDAHGLELVWLPWFTPTVSPSGDSLWAPTIPFPIAPTILEADSPEPALENGEYFAKYSYLGESFDLSFMGGWFWNDTPAFAVTDKTIVPGVGISALTVRPEYYRTAAAGAAVSGTLGPLVLRAEGAWYADKRWQGNPLVYSEGYAEKDAVQYLVGTDFSVAGYSFGLQFIQDLILDHEDDLTEEAVRNTATFVVAKTFLRDTLTAEIFAYAAFDPLNALVKPKLTWDASDALEFFAGAYLFLGDEGDFGQYDDNDGVYAGAKLSF